MFLSYELFALFQIRTGLSSEKLFPLEELFYKHGKNQRVIGYFAKLQSHDSNRFFNYQVVKEELNNRSSSSKKVVFGGGGGSWPGF